MSYQHEVYEHYRRIREDPVYRLNEMMLELKAQMLPAMSSYEAQIPESGKMIPFDLRAKSWRARKIQTETSPTVKGVDVSATLLSRK